MREFSTTTFGKWILAGEHAVLRGCPALAFPFSSRSLQLEYSPSTNAIEVEFSGPHGEELKLLFYGVLENALSRLHRGAPQGRFRLINSLPVGAGLGASAALCGAVSRWCEAQGWIQTGEVYEFARRLEDLFHGESSGVDLAVSLSSRGVRFLRGQGFVEIEPLWWPRLYLSYSGQRGMTSECVNKVKALFQTAPEKAEAIDRRMREAVDLAEKALVRSPEDEGRRLLKQAIDIGLECFQAWGLCQGELGTHIELLKKGGATAVKPTGSGGGGFCLSFWQDEPPSHLRELLLPIPRPLGTSQAN